MVFYIRLSVIYPGLEIVLEILVTQFQLDVLVNLHAVMYASFKQCPT